MAEANGVYKKVLSRKRLFLLDNLSGIQGILDRLIRDEIIDEKTCRDIRDILNNKTRSEAIRVLIEDVLSASRTNYDAFLGILEEEKLHEVKEELLKEERLITETGTCCITEKLEEINLEDNSTERHDICILFEDEDEEIAMEVKSFLETIAQPNESPIRIVLYNDARLFQFDSITSKLEKIARLTTMQFYIVPQYGNEDKKLKWARDSLILNGLSDGKFTVHKVLTEENNKNNSNVVLSNLQEIKWYYRHKDFFRKRMKTIIDGLIKDRPKIKDSENK